MTRTFNRLPLAASAHRVPSLGWVIALALVICFEAPRAEPPVVVRSQPVHLNPRDPGATRVGHLRYRGGLDLRSSDPHFGGFSALHVSADGSTLLAVSDRGRWLTLALGHDKIGRLVRADGTKMGVLIGVTGKPLMYRDTDAEALTVLPDGSILVGFERNHRILHYPAASPPFSRRPVRLSNPPGFETIPVNQGIEALAHRNDGSIVAIAEFLTGRDNALAAWIGRAGAWKPFVYATQPGFRVSDAASMPNGDLLVLEHHYNIITGHVVRFVQVSGRSIGQGRRVEGRELARLASPLTTENFEGVSVRRERNGEFLIYAISDDNFNPKQRTLLLMFAAEDSDIR